MADAPAPGRPLQDSDFVEVVDKDSGERWPNPIPKHWVGTDLAPNAKQASGSRAAGSGESGS